MAAEKNEQGPLAAIIVLVLAVVVVAAMVVAYRVGKVDGRADACTTGKVYAVDDAEVNIAASALKVAMLPSTPKASRDYLIEHATKLLDLIGKAGPLQVECR